MYIRADVNGDVTKEDFPVDPNAWYKNCEEKVFAMISYSRDRLRRDVLKHRQGNGQNNPVKLNWEIAGAEEAEIESEKVFGLDCED